MSPAYFVPSTRYDFIFGVVHFLMIIRMTVGVGARGGKVLIPTRFLYRVARSNHQPCSA